MPLFFGKEVQHKVIVHIFCQYGRNSRLYQKRNLTQPKMPLLTVPKIQKTGMTWKTRIQFCETSNLIPVKLSFLIGKQVLFTGNKQVLLYVDFNGLFNLSCDVLVSKQGSMVQGKTYWLGKLEQYCLNVCCQNGRVEDGCLEDCLFFNPLLITVFTDTVDEINYYICRFC